MIFILLARRKDIPLAHESLYSQPGWGIRKERRKMEEEEMSTWPLSGDFREGSPCHLHGERGTWRELLCCSDD